jgi:diadenosine tetraphosphate (Ap4A) HIT family hydrolase
VLSTEEIPFRLDPLLEKDLIFLMEFPLCKLLLMNDANFPWFILVPRREGIVEVFDLNDEDRSQLSRESDYLLRILKEHYQAKKMNVANLGNMVPQLHIHHIVRYEEDLAWPGPIWGAAKPVPYTVKKIELITNEVRTLLASFQE